MSGEGNTALSVESQAGWRRIAALLDAEAAELTKIGDTYGADLLERTAGNMRGQAPEVPSSTRTPRGRSRSRPPAASAPESPPKLTLVT